MARIGALLVLTVLVVAAPVLAWSSPSPAGRRATVAAIRKKSAAAGVKHVERHRRECGAICLGQRSASGPRLSPH